MKNTKHVSIINEELNSVDENKAINKNVQPKSREDLVDQGFFHPRKLSKTEIDLLSPSYSSSPDKTNVKNSDEKPSSLIAKRR